MRSKTDIDEGGFSPDLTSSILKNQVLKTKIILVLFTIIFLTQTIILTILVSTNSPIIQSIPLSVAICGPLYILLGVFCEFLYLRTLKRRIQNNTFPKPFFTYLVAFTEISFPGTVILMVTSLVGNEALLPISEIINSPPFIIYFILIILSSLNLDKKLSIFVGLIAATQYIALCMYLKFHFSLQVLFIPNIILKGCLILVCGLAAGFVSEKIKLALIEALHAQDKLINQLDAMVKEKTKEVTEQKTEIEQQHSKLKEKQKEIVDSIHYAKRIQNSLMPNEKYITKKITELNK